MSDATEPWHVRRLRELEAAVPVKRKKTEPFVKVPLRWIEAAAKATGSPTTMLLIELLRLRWKTQSDTFPLPNNSRVPGFLMMPSEILACWLCLGDWR